MIKKSNKLTRKLCLYYLPHYYAETFQRCAMYSKLTHPLAASSLNNQNLDSIHA